MLPSTDHQTAKSRIARFGAWLRAAFSLGLAVTLLVVVIPRLAGTQWSSILSVLGAVTLTQFVVLAVLWAVGLVAHSVTLAAAMPNLGGRRALMLSLTGSAISNVLPVGGAAGITLNYRMSRDWGFEPLAIGIYTVVTNVWDVLVRLSLPALALAWLIIGGGYGAGLFISTATVATIALVGFAILTATLFVSGRAADRVGSLLDRAGNSILRLTRRDRRLSLRSSLVRARRETAHLVRSAWPRLTFGVVAYAALLGVLLWACLSVVGAGVAIPAVLAGLAMERVITLLPITPGGVGLVEVGLSGLLIALGGAPAATVTGVILYRFFTYGIEIPIGGAGVLSWLLSRRAKDRIVQGALS